jgi:hypothetical protein
MTSLDERGNQVAWDKNGNPVTVREQRWLELYRKHDDAWRL